MRFKALPVTSFEDTTLDLEQLQIVLTPTLVTSLPASPTDGQTIDYVADTTNGIVWRFRYRAASASTHKWEFVGGSPLTQVIDAQAGPLVWGAGNINTWLDNSGPQVTAPLAGDYLVSHSTSINHLVAGTQMQVGVSVILTAAGFALAQSVDRAGNTWFPLSVAPTTVTGVLATSVLRQQYQADTAGNMFTKFRKIAAWPIRVG